MSVTRTAWTDDDGSGTTGTILNNSEKTALYDQIDARWSEATTTSTGTQNDLAFSEADVLRCNNATDLTITGLVAPASPAKPGKRLIIVSVGAGKVLLKHQNAGSTAANRLINIATSGDTPLAAGSGIAIFVYDSTTARWRLVHHDQGAVIATTYAAGDFTGNGAMTWTVEAGDFAYVKYRLVGSVLEVWWNLSATTVGGTPNTTLLIALPGGFAVANASSEFAGEHNYSDNGGADTLGYVYVDSSLAKLQVRKVGSGSWTASTNLTGTTGAARVNVS